MTWPNTILIRVQTLYVITYKSNSGNLTRAGRSDDESTRGRNSNESNDGSNNEDTDKHNVSSETGE